MVINKMGQLGNDEKSCYYTIDICIYYTLYMQNIEKLFTISFGSVYITSFF